MSTQIMNQSIPTALTPPLPQDSTQPLRWGRLYGSARALAIARAARSETRPVLVVCRDQRQLQVLEAELRFFLGSGSDIPLLPYPDWECLPYDAFSPHPDIVSQRLLVLSRLPGLGRGVVLVTASNLVQRVPPQEYVGAYSFALASGDTIDLDRLREQMLACGYQSVSQVMAPGEYALRGGLVDIFPMGSRAPFRIDLFGDEVESIRYFDPETQLSTDRTSSIQLLPAREFPLDENGVRCFRRRFRETFSGDPQRSPLYRDVSKGFAPAGIEYYLPLFFDHTATLFDYLPKSCLFVVEDGVMPALATFEKDTAGRYQSASFDIERPPLEPAALFIPTIDASEAVEGYRRINLAALEDPEAPGIPLGTTPVPVLPVEPRAPAPYARLLEFLKQRTGRTLLVAETRGHCESLSGLLRDHGMEPELVDSWDRFLGQGAMLALAIAPLERGLWLETDDLLLLTEAQLYGERVMQRRRRAHAAREPEAIIRSLAELNTGDPVVHIDHGVGRYLGLQRLDLGDQQTEFLTLEYRDGDKLYIPVMSLDLISRYTSANPEQAPLHKLGSKDWEKIKRRAREKVRDVAVEILEIQALRNARKGHAFPAPDESYDGFCAGFPFEETPDQERAIRDVIDDMMRERPMDRLVCGDVGFGKTEVALRAAFMAVQERQQVAVLVPTTLLAQQHYETFSDRFAGQAVEIELLSRFRTPKEIGDALERIAAGKVDIAIGTHRLLQPDVSFRQLGLVIIDEEHRFGVRQKEALKKLRSRVDILTLTATPIPRTLNMALSSVRDISIIATPPQERMSVRTFVTEWSDAHIREACLREFRRGGLVYFLHNDVKTMASMEDRLHKLVPEADIAIAHGQMPERELERVMQDFYHQRFNLLLCSTIIESGIDVPVANTILIHRADRFGLAQLHQLRGRVGRSHHQAFAYLLIPPRSVLKGDALKRLEAIAGLDELGAGFALASHDLEIRGGGELLGESQSGLIDEIGFSMYMDLLDRAMESAKQGRPVSTRDGGVPRETGNTEIELHLPVLLPDSYLPDVHTRLVLYKRIASARSPTELEELKAEIMDRFGPLPGPGQNLFHLTRLKLAARPLGIRKADIGPRGGTILFAENPDIDPQRLIEVITGSAGELRMEGPTRLRTTCTLEEPDQRIDYLWKLLQRLGAGDVTTEVVP